jgi:hypothetical protein
MQPPNLVSEDRRREKASLLVSSHLSHHPPIFASGVQMDIGMGSIVEAAPIRRLGRDEEKHGMMYKVEPST